MAIGKGNAQMNIKIGLEKLQQVEEFTYLVAVTASDGSCRKHMIYNVELEGIRDVCKT